MYIIPTGNNTIVPILDDHELKDEDWEHMPYAAKIVICGLLAIASIGVELLIGWTIMLFL